LKVAILVHCVAYCIALVLFNSLAGYAVLCNIFF
jgi:hypothetical protein